ncbi:MAG: methylmalonyl Co-A mutase-associated GTPase MeaB [Alphaproteobacteria bacterium GM7ARS4]|nr:methylmalonyl Co-A mutase-associated GTPase MeaB [Alphaproteobacteria bacterium GM7ARS4]
MNVPPRVSLEDIRFDVKGGGKALLASVLNQFEGHWLRASSRRHHLGLLLDEAHLMSYEESGYVLGVTGAPGVGKSTLIGQMLVRWARQQRSMAVVAIDPSSPVSGGSLLGDRVRFRHHLDHRGMATPLFIRSCAARDQLGGIAHSTFFMTLLLRSLFDIVIVETVGVGQSETDIRHCTDLVMLCLQPQAGDSLQFLKAGIMEIPDIILMTKSDLDKGQKSYGDMVSALSLQGGANDIRLCSVSTHAHDKDRHVDGLLAQIEDAIRVKQQDGAVPLRARRARQIRHWLERLIRERCGVAFLEHSKAHQLITSEDIENRPFHTLTTLLTQEEQRFHKPSSL